MNTNYNAVGMTPQQIHKAYRQWALRYYPFLQADNDVRPFLTNELKAYCQSSEQSWLRKSRNALLLSSETMARRLGISRNSYADFEESEKTGGISLNSLSKAAEAMGCELVYGIRPKKKTTFSEIIWQVLFNTSANHHLMRSRPSVKWADTLTGLAKDKMYNSQFRRKIGWSQRRKFKPEPELQREG